MKKLLLLSAIGVCLLSACNNVAVIQTGDAAKISVVDDKLENYNVGDSVIVITDIEGRNEISNDGYKSLHTDTTIDFTQYRVGVIISK